MTIACLLLALATPSALDLLDRTIAHHDPQGRWPRAAVEITEASTRRDGTTGRLNVLRIDNARGRFEAEITVDGRLLRATVQGDTVAEVSLDGKTDLSKEEVERYRLTPAQILSARNFHLFLWGVPMKLRDPGTRLDPRVKETDFQGKPVYELRVTYDENVGKDTWYFYLDRETSALVGHRFNHDESQNDGEYAVLSEEAVGQGLKLPRVRKWYRNQGSELFITHTLLSIRALPAHLDAEPGDRAREEEAIRKDRLDRVERFNRHEPPQAGNFAEEADFVNVYGMWRRGGAEIESRQGDRMRTVLKDARINLLDLRIRFLSPTIALVHQTHEMIGMRDPAGNTMPTHQERGLHVLVKVKDRWLTTAFHNTIVRPQEATPGTR